MSCLNDPCQPCLALLDLFPPNWLILLDEGLSKTNYSADRFGFTEWQCLHTLGVAFAHILGA